MELEKSVCGIREPIVFWLWSSIAGRSDPSHLTGLANVEDISFQTLDGRILRGYKLKAEVTGSDPDYGKGYLLVAQGNATLSDQLIGSFTRYSNAGIDVYIFDYRGYGRSEGKRRLKAMVSDYREIIELLNSRPYTSSLYYAMSFGGIVLLNALKETQERDRIVIDSSPSRLSDYGCPEQFDPVNNFPEEASNVLVIAGVRDRVVTPSMSKELFDLAQESGATVLRDPDMAHPFMDRNVEVHNRRLNIVSSFLLKAETANEE